MFSHKALVLTELKMIVFTFGEFKENLALTGNPVLFFEKIREQCYILQKRKSNTHVIICFASFMNLITTGVPLLSPFFFFFLLATHWRNVIVSSYLKDFFFFTTFIKLWYKNTKVKSVSREDVKSEMQEKQRMFSSRYKTYIRSVTVVFFPNFWANMRCQWLTINLKK